MGYEYDYVFDWMVKKPNPQNSIQQKNEEEKQNDQGVSNTPGAGDANQNSTAHLGAANASTGNNNATQQ